MPIGTLASEASVEVPSVAKPEAYALKPMVGYCADCGTWDAHGRFCTACGYDFAPPAMSDPSELAPL